MVEADTGRMLGTVDPGSACATVHPGAVYLHQGSSYVVDELDLESGLAHGARRGSGVDHPAARRRGHLGAAHGASARVIGGVDVCLGEVAVTSQVVGYLRRLPSGEVLDQVPLDLPERTLQHPGGLVHGRRGPAGRRPGRAHRGCPARCTRPSTPRSACCRCSRPATGGTSAASPPRCTRTPARPTVFVHDGHPGGAGFADRGFAALIPWLTATRDAISSCECPAGCPSCVQSPKCGNGNEPLDKAGAVAVLDVVLRKIAVA